MEARHPRLLFFCLMALIAIVTVHTAAAARPFPAGSVCHAAAGLEEDEERVLADRGRWTCDPAGWPIDSSRAYLRFDLAGAEPPMRFVTRLTRFEAMRITAIGTDGRLVAREVREADMTPLTTAWRMATALPKLGEPAAAIVVRVDGARHSGFLADAKVVPDRPETAAEVRGELLVAALCGMLCLPLVFNFAFLRVLRERFLLWHALAVVCMLGQTLITSGVVNRFANLSLEALCVSSAVTWGLGIVAAAMFSADFIEPGMLDRVHRRLMRGTAPWIGGWTAFYLLASGDLRPYAPPLYFASFAPVLALFAWVMLVAWRRGSRAVKFQIVAWLPIMMTGAVRIASALGATDAPLELELEQHVSLALEIIVTSLGAADRFMTIRRERDLAVADLRVFADRAERDALTGLLNRRAIERRFDLLHSEGFRTMAVIDLDQFKSVNDMHGHLTGDAVLRAAAEALEPDDDTLAIRLGGEEFLLLLRGTDAVIRAERRRQAIPVRVAARMPGLGRIVTASMGLVEQPQDPSIRADFKSLYGHCDRLLYEAKHTGRNRTMRERVQSFGARAARAA